ncbi:MAG: phosphatidylglycerol lysyltransferase, partial [bacterium]|nr:phosphatidylglycerol lysyltransferase [bacterium]
MPIIYDKKTGFKIADTEAIHFGKNIPNLAGIEKALKPMILSASGWRKIFASDNDEESRTEEIGQSDKIISAAMAYTFSNYIKEKSGKKNPVVSLAMDSRFTGPAIADIMCRVFVSLDIKVQYIFICAAPEVMSWAGRSRETDGFAYISASHNPIGHNGVKFGLTTGGVLDGKQASILIGEFKKILSTDKNIKKLAELTDNTSTIELEKIYNQTGTWKSRTYKNYTTFTEEVICGTGDKKVQKKIFKKISDSARHKPVGIIAEHNGSARTLSIDKEILESLNIKVKCINDKPREITHRIVPEGFSLDLCRTELEKEH